MKYYRIENILVSAGVDEFDNPLGPGQVHVYLHDYEVLKVTAKGVWLDVYGSRRFVLNEGRKRFAHPTLDEARESFLARKRKQIRILSTQIGNAELAIDIVKHDRRFNETQKVPCTVHSSGLHLQETCSQA